MSIALEAALDQIRSTYPLPVKARQQLANVAQSLGDLRRLVERQASYLTDISTPDARRRRSQQKIAERFDAAARMLQPAIRRRHITLENQIPETLKSPAMYPAELTAIFSNLLSNAIKAAGPQGKIRALANITKGRIEVRLENTGVTVDLEDADRWFRPFESTTQGSDVDHVLGQGFGMGLPITRNILEEYGGQIGFVEPSPGMATAIRIIFP